MNYKGEERFSFEEAEQSWMSGAQYEVIADIAICFPSIYTHSIPWALHGKSAAKNNNSLTDLAGNLLDKCTQNTRERQTNGLIIGPHASNIISEILLTKIDTSLQKKGYTKVKRHIDDYRFFASSFDEAERFIKDLGLELRVYEMSLNEKKTKILPLPRPSDEDWVLVLNRHPLPKDQELRYTEVRSYLDRALTCANLLGKSTPLNYAIKVLAKSDSDVNDNGAAKPAPRQLGLRAKRMYTQEVMNLALAYPYLAPLLDENVFVPYWHDGLKTKISEFATALIVLGLRRLFPDTIAHAIFLALKYDLTLNLKDRDLFEIVRLDDCVSNVLLREYGKRRNRIKLEKVVNRCAEKLKQGDQRDKDLNWLLIYQAWSTEELKGNGQGFLAELKEINFEFFKLPKPAEESSVT